MEDYSVGTFIVGFILAIVIYRVVYHRPVGRFVPVPVALVLGIGLAMALPLVLPHVLPTIRAVWLGLGLPPLTGGAVFIGAWVAVLLASFLPRARPIWQRSVIAVAVGLVAAYGVPPLMDAATGRFNNASLRADVNHCTDGMVGRVQPRVVTNTCAEEIVVGLCLPGERNPAPCAQSVRVAPGQTVTLDPGEARLSSVPGNPGGLTVVACRPPDRPSRTGRVTGRGFDGVCLPPA